MRAPAVLPTLSLSHVEMRSIEFLDKPFIQASAFHLLVGKKGNFKGTWLSHLTARVTRGELHGQPRHVLVVSSEDSASIDLKPRIVAAGGDPDRVSIVTGAFLLPRDVDALKATIRAHAAALVIIDPVGNHLGGGDTDREGFVRDAISRLNEVADELACTIIGVRHLAKDVSKGALASVLGSTAWTDTPRAVLGCAVDDENDLVFHVQVIAGNRGPRGEAGRRYTVDLVTLDGLKEPVTRATPSGASSKSMDDLLDRGHGPRASSSDNARELILDLLEERGQMESDTLDAHVAAQAGIAASTVRNLRTELRRAGLIKPIPDKDEHGQVQRWLVARTAAPRPSTRDLDAAVTSPDHDSARNGAETAQPRHITSTSPDTERRDVDVTKNTESGATSRLSLCGDLGRDLADTRGAAEQ